MSVRGDILNNPNEGDKFAYWGEWGEGLGDAFGPRLEVLRDPSRIRVLAFGSIAIARKNDRNREARGGGNGVWRGSGLTGDVRTHHGIGINP